MYFCTYFSTDRLSTIIRFYAIYVAIYITTLSASRGSWVGTT